MLTSILFPNPKFPANIGTVARNGELLGVDHLYVSRYERTGKNVGCTDTAKSFSRIGTFVDDDISLLDHYRRNLAATIIAVEMSPEATPVQNAVFPENVLFILGSEDKGIDEELWKMADFTVTIPSLHRWSFNVADAATIVVWERFSQRLSSKT